MKSKSLVLALVVCALAFMSGCSRAKRPLAEEATMPQAATSRQTKVESFDIGADEMSIQNDLKLVSDWKNHPELLYQRHHFLSNLNGKIRHAKSGALYARYIDQFLNEAFEIPVDAVDAGTRTRQFDSFKMVTDAAICCTAEREDYNRFWSNALRRLKFICEELDTIESYLAGQGEGNRFHGDKDGWEQYHKAVRRAFYSSEENLTSIINNFLMTSVLSQEEWSAFHGQLEKILHHRVPIKGELMELWRIRQKKPVATEEPRTK